jgi:hypothetical protein
MLPLHAYRPVPVRTPPLQRHHGSAAARAAAVRQRVSRQSHFGGWEEKPSKFNGPPPDVSTTLPRRSRRACAVFRTGRGDARGSGRRRSKSFWSALGSVWPVRISFWPSAVRKDRLPDLARLSVPGECSGCLGRDLLPQIPGGACLRSTQTERTIASIDPCQCHRSTSPCSVRQCSNPLKGRPDE